MIASDKYDFQWVLSLLDRGETSRVECKLAAKAIPDSFWESYSAFANTDGGIVLLGIKEENRRFSIEGVSDAKKLVADFWNTVNGSKVSANVVSGYARPTITESFDPERTRVDVEIEVVEKSTEKRGEYTGKLTEKHGECTEKSTERRVALTETEEKIISILENNGYSTQKVISTKLGITRTYVTKIMGELQTKGVIRRVGPDKGGHWEVVK